MENRIREILKDKGLTIATLAERIESTQPALSMIISGRRKLSLDYIDKISKALSVAPEEIISTPWQDIPISGYVGAGAEVYPIDDLAESENSETVSIPSIIGKKEELAAVTVRGESMYPRYYEGENIIYRRLDEIPQRVWNKECVCALDDGRLLVKVLQPIAGINLFVLKSHNAPDIVDVSVIWVGEIVGRF